MSHRLCIVHAKDDEDWVRGYLVPRLGLDEGVHLIRDIRPGTVIGTAIEDAVVRSRYVLVVLSKAWEADGWAKAATELSEHLSKVGRGTVTIPCIREDCNVSLSLETLQGIDCRDHAQPRGAGIETQAEKGLVALRTMLEAPEPAAPEELACPYPGMVAFESRELFFGRDREIERLVAHMRNYRRTVTVGPSGSGKSSLLRAALLPETRTADTAAPIAGTWPRSRARLLPRLPDTWPVLQVRLLDRPCAQRRWQAMP